MEKIIETKICKQCSVEFDITDKDIEFYEKVSPVFNGVKYNIPTPTLCPDCRQQRRLAWRNERKLYKRNCDATGKQIISIYSPDKPYKVYDSKVWWSDSWNPMDYGRDFDFNRGFFEQFEELFREVPKMGLMNNQSENSEFTNDANYNKNCYLCFGVDRSEDCYYLSTGVDNKNCIDGTEISSSEHCYECINSFGMYESFYCNDCIDSKYCFGCKDCSNCENCIGCKGLTNKQYHIFNKSYPKEEYLEKISYLKRDINKLLKEVHDFHQTIPNISLDMYNCENSLGNNIVNSKNIFMCFNVGKAINIKYCHNIFDIHDSYDSFMGSKGSSLIYETQTCLGICYNSAFCSNINNGIKFGYYCSNCVNSSNLFGCIGLRNKQYCILNKQYTREEYNELVPKIIEHMKKTGEWGEFFPASISPFGYNETVAMEYYPLEKEKAVESSFNWSLYESPKPEVSKIIPANSLPENINDIPDDILNWAIECEVTGRPYRIIKQELEFYRKHNLPIPRRHPDERHLDRLRQRNPRKLFDRKCDKCSKDIISTYSPEREEIVYCEECYEKEVL